MERNISVPQKTSVHSTALYFVAPLTTLSKDCDPRAHAIAVPHAVTFTVTWTVGPGNYESFRCESSHSSAFPNAIANERGGHTCNDPLRQIIGYIHFLHPPSAQTIIPSSSHPSLRIWTTVPRHQPNPTNPAIPLAQILL